MAWEAREIESDPLNLYNANIFAPELGALAFSSLNLAPMLVEYPMLRASGNPILAYNFVYAFAWWLIGYSVFLLSRYLGLGVGPAIVSGMLTEFSSFSFSQIGHLEILWFGWIPLFLLSSLIVLRRPTVKYSFIAAFFFLLASLATWYLAIYLSLAVIALMLFSLRFAMLRGSLAVGGVVVVAWLVLIPFALPYLQIESGYSNNRTLDQVEYYSAHADSYVRVPALNKTWRAILGTGDRGESNFFPGIAFFALAVFGAQRFWRRGAYGRYWICLGAVGVALSFGPFLRLGLTIPLPEYLLRLIPGYSLTRVPSRWALFAVIAFAMCAGEGVQRVANRSLSLAVVTVLIALVETFCAPLPTSSLPMLDTLEPEYRWLALQPQGSIVELPITVYPESSESAVGYMYRSIFHHHSLVNGYADYIPDWYYPLAEASKNFPSSESVTLFKEHGARFVVVHTDQFRMHESDALIPAAQFPNAIIYQLPEVNLQP